MTRVELLERLKQLQQTPKFQGRDITTVSALLTNAALAKHVEFCEEAAAAQGRSAPQEERSGASGRR